ncbi:MAG: phosphoadenylyl-sulfate reductase [Pseudonocardiales bacterium]|nr:phosphoadenylyl-sulfate reductase [Pseudonocardiales bacterium]MBV9727922.1 phosphoadenylyl-sulfate reductase [Pseudonocardiales bacterium]
MTATVNLEQLARRAGRELDAAPAQEIVRWAVQTFGARFAVATSMQDAVLVHLVSRVAPGVDVLFLDTGYHFAETLGTRDAVAATYDVNLITVTPRQTVAEQDASYGPQLHDRDPDWCCWLRKVAPLDRTLAHYDAWITGLRRAEAPTRASTPVVSYDAQRGKVKISPIAAWSDADVEDYIATHGILINPLLTVGYPSIGCAPCTRAVAVGEDPRAGRWAGSAKTECGIHR